MIADFVNICKEDKLKRKICSCFVPHTLIKRDNRQAVLGSTNSDCARPPSVFARFSTCSLLLFSKVKFHLKRRLFDSFSDIQIAVTRTLNTTAKNDFHKGIQNLYDRANLCVYLQGIYVENKTIKVSFISSKCFLQCQS